MIISFAWTTPALLAEPPRKSVTRRNWKPQHAANFHKGDIVDAWDKSPRYGGKKVATIRLTEEPFIQSTDKAPWSDFDAEGFSYLESIGAKLDGWSPTELWWSWQEEPQLVYVVRFERISVESSPIARAEGYEYRVVRRL